MTLWTDIKNTSLAVSEIERAPRTPADIALHTLTELGELAQEIIIAEGRSYKEPGKDGVIGEAIDIMICAADYVMTRHPNIDEKKLITSWTLPGFPDDHFVGLENAIDEGDLFKFCLLAPQSGYGLKTLRAYQFKMMADFDDVLAFCKTIGGRNASQRESDEFLIPDTSVMLTVGCTAIEAIRLTQPDITEVLKLSQTPDQRIAFKDLRARIGPAEDEELVRALSDLIFTGDLKAIYVFTSPVSGKVVAELESFTELEPQYTDPDTGEVLELQMHRDVEIFYQYAGLNVLSPFMETV